MIIFVFKVFEFDHFKKLRKQRKYASASFDNVILSFEYYYLSSEISSKSGIDALRVRKLVLDLPFHPNVLYLPSSLGFQTFLTVLS